MNHVRSVLNIIPKVDRTEPYIHFIGNGQYVPDGNNEEDSDKEQDTENSENE